jgi:hypothetical protein
MVNGSVTKLPVGESGLIDVGQIRLKLSKFGQKSHQDGAKVALCAANFAVASNCHVVLTGSGLLAITP